MQISYAGIFELTYLQLQCKLEVQIPDTNKNIRADPSDMVVIRVLEHHHNGIDHNILA